MDSYEYYSVVTYDEAVPNFCKFYLATICLSFT